MNTERQTPANRPATASIRAAEAACAISDGEIVLARIDVAVPPARVFRALLTDECERWWGAPGVYTTRDAERMRDYPFYPAAMGELELRSGSRESARAHLEAALALARNDAERRFLNRRLEACGHHPSSASDGRAVPS